MMNRMEISGLTKRQVQMLKYIWTCQSEEEFAAWISQLPWNEQLIAESLLRMMQYEVMEAYLDPELKDAKTVLEKYVSKGSEH